MAKKLADLEIRKPSAQDQDAVKGGKHKAGLRKGHMKQSHATKATLRSTGLARASIRATED